MNHTIWLGGVLLSVQLFERNVNDLTRFGVISASGLQCCFRISFKTFATPSA